MKTITLFNPDLIRTAANGIRSGVPVMISYTVYSVRFFLLILFIPFFAVFGEETAVPENAQIAEEKPFELPFILELKRWKPEERGNIYSDLWFYDHSVKSGGVPAPFSDRYPVSEDGASRTSVPVKLIFLSGLLLEKNKILRKVSLEFSSESLLRKKDTLSITDLNHIQSGKIENKYTNQYAGIRFRIFSFRWIGFSVTGGIDKTTVNIKNSETGNPPYRYLHNSMTGSTKGYYTGYRVSFPLPFMNHLFQKLSENNRIYFNLFASGQLSNNKSGSADFIEFYGDGSGLQIALSRMKSFHETKDYGITASLRLQNEMNLIFGAGFRKDINLYEFPEYLGISMLAGGSPDINEILADHLLYSYHINREELSGMIFYMKISGIQL